MKKRGQQQSRTALPVYPSIAELRAEGWVTPEENELLAAILTLYTVPGFDLGGIPLKEFEIQVRVADLGDGKLRTMFKIIAPESFMERMQLLEQPT